ncbi:Peptidyl-prolyl cis-trans isomerase (EC 5.2.1.8) [Azospirillum doebereinerae]
MPPGGFALGGFSPMVPGAEFGTIGVFRMLRWTRVLLAALFATFLISQGEAKALDPENTLYLDLKDGRVVIEMRPDLAPNHVARIKELTRQGFYNGVVFHRVIDGFMAQTGDPTGTGSGGSGKKLKAEFSATPHIRGTLSMARTPDPDSADSQFFICFAPSSFLDRQYTVWGRVVEGMEFVDQIKKGSQSANGSVKDPDKIVKMQVAADVK